MCRFKKPQDIVAAINGTHKQQKYLIFRAADPGKPAGVSLISRSGLSHLDLHYSVDGAPFQKWDGSQITIPIGGELRLFGNNDVFITDSHPEVRFVFDALIEADGFMSAISKTCTFGYLFAGSDIVTTPYIDYTEVPKSGCLGMFENCTYLRTIRNFPNAVIGDSGMRKTFRGCSLLKYIPKRWDFVSSNYSSFDETFANSRITYIPYFQCSAEDFDLVFTKTFSGCTYIEDLEDVTLPSVFKNGKLTNPKFIYTFENCTNLRMPPSFEVLDYVFAYSMFANSGLIEMPTLPATGTFDSMFQGCTGLIAAILNFQTIKEGETSCSAMFKGCTSISEVPDIDVEEIGDFTCIEMFSGCSKIRTISIKTKEGVGSSALTGAFENCTSLQRVLLDTPTIDRSECISSLFEGCTSLQTIEVTFTAWNDNASFNWVKGVAASGTFTKPESLTEEFGDSRIPTGWTVVNK